MKNIPNENIEVSEEKYRKIIQRLKESEEKYRNITDQLLVGIFILQDNVFKYVNEALSKINEYSIQEMLNWTPKEFLDSVHPDDRQEIYKLTSKRQEGDKNASGSISCRVITKSGKIKWIESYGKTIMYQGKPADMAMVIDVSESKIARQKLKESEEKYRVITESANDIISIINENFDLEYQNEEATYNILGYTNEEILSSSALERLHPDEIKRVIKVFREGFKKGEAQTEIRTKHKDGHYIWFDIKGRTFINGNGEKKGIIISRDIMERKIAEQKLKESEEKFRLISEQALLGISIIQDGKVKYINEAALLINEYSREEAMAWNEHELFKTIHPDDVQYIMLKLKEYETGVAEAITLHFIFRVISKSGKVKWVEQYSNPIFYQGKRATVNFTSEITKRIKTQERLKEALERETFFKKLFTHDVNSVLNNIQNSLSLFTLYQENPEKQEELRKIISILKEQVIRGAHLVSNIRHLSDLEEDKLHLESIYATKVLQDAIKQVQEGFQTRIIDIRIESHENSILVKANDLLLNIFENILNNAVKYNENPIVEIVIRISKQHEDGINYVKFEFMDNGIGIDDLVKKTIFKEGYKKEKGGKGLGFGLSLVRKIIEIYKGKIWVEDKIIGDYTKGSNFVLLIPLS